MLINNAFNYNNKIIFLLTLLWLSITDFGLFLNPFGAPLILSFFVILQVQRLPKIKTVSYVILTYSACIIISLALNLTFNNNFNNLLIIPVLAYVVLKISKHADIEVKLILDKYLKLIVLLTIFLSITELYFKISGNQIIPFHDSFINNFGDRRYDVLRARSFFGSSLSTAALSTFFSIYFFVFQKSNTYILLTGLLILLTGSRTAFVLFSLIALFAYLKNFRFNKKIQKLNLMRIAYFYSFIGIATVAIAGSQISHIARRALTISIDASFLGRASTTGSTYLEIINQLPRTIFVGVEGNFVSDSALISIVAGSGIFAFVVFLCLLVYLIFSTERKVLDKFLVCGVFILGSLMIGDFFIPAVTFLYVITFIAYRNGSPPEKWSC